MLRKWLSAEVPRLELGKIQKRVCAKTKMAAKSPSPVAQREAVLVLKLVANGSENATIGERSENPGPAPSPLSPLRSGTPRAQPLAPHQGSISAEGTPSSKAARNKGRPRGTRRDAGPCGGMDGGRAGCMAGPAPQQPGFVFFTRKGRVMHPTPFRACSIRQLKGHTPPDP